MSSIKKISWVVLVTQIVLVVVGFLLFVATLAIAGLCFYKLFHKEALPPVSANSGVVIRNPLVDLNKKVNKDGTRVAYYDAVKGAIYLLDANLATVGWIEANINSEFKFSEDGEHLAIMTIWKKDVWVLDYFGSTQKIECQPVDVRWQTDENGQSKLVVTTKDGGVITQSFPSILKRIKRQQHGGYRDGVYYD